LEKKIGDFEQLFDAQKKTVIWCQKVIITLLLKKIAILLLKMGKKRLKQL
jgi:hypothetical protein